MKFNKFSLVELLVVVAIIGILFSLLMPMLAKSREKARESVCVSHQKQLSTALFMYATDHDNYVPANNTWRELILPYIQAEREDDEVYNCPLSKISHVTWTEQGIGFNKRMGNLVNDRANAHNDTIVKLTRVNSPTDTILIGDTNDNFTTNWSLWKRLVLPSEQAQRTFTVSDRHRDGLNSSWVDGHVKWSSRLEIFYGNGNPDDDYYYEIEK